jgi:hypothetical protein
MASIFCEWKSASRASSSFSAACRRSVISRVILAKPINAPASCRIASMTTLAQKRVPPLGEQEHGEH